MNRFSHGSGAFNMSRDLVKRFSPLTLSYYLLGDMLNRFWSHHSFNNRYYHSDSDIVNEFLNSFILDLEAKSISIKGGERYNDQVFRLLDEYKSFKSSPDDEKKLSSDDEEVFEVFKKKSSSDPEKRLVELQRKIENLTSSFNEPSIYDETSNLIRLLIGDNPSNKNAKYYLKGKISKDLYDSTIVQFGEYTLEAIIIYVLGVLFNSIQVSSVVRVSKLVDLLDRTVRTQASIIRSQRESSKDSKEGDIKPKKGKKFELGEKLLYFMMEREVIYMTHLSSIDKAVVKEKGKGYKIDNLMAVCNFDLSLLPLKLKLPMVSKPLEWVLPTKVGSSLDSYLDFDKKSPLLLSDMRGGYLSGPPLNLYNLYSQIDDFGGVGLLSSYNISNFNIELNEDKYKEMISILNGLQNQGFMINKKVLEFFKENRSTLEKLGLFMPSILAHLNMKEAFDLLRASYYQNQAIKKACDLGFLLKEFAIRAQKARYEDFIIRLGSAYEGFVFYLPAFMDFRGRIYRSGILHFHMGDLARSLIVFANNHQEEEGNYQSTMDIVASAAAFKYKKFFLYDDALLWFKEKLSEFSAYDESLISFAKEAKEPYQFIAKALCYDSVLEYGGMPISQDASASAYQIMSYLLLNEDMARNTNLIPHPNGKIQDVYMYLLQDLKAFLHNKINDSMKIQIIESLLNRKLVKRLFMPLIYGKTLMSMGMDIMLTYGQLLSNKDSYNLAKLSNDFWTHKYPDIVNLMKLISLVSWLCSAMDRAVVYSIPYFTTRQDYMSFVTENIIVYERSTKKRRKVTLRVPTQKRDRRKTAISTCANFIHQKDAYIAMKVIESLLRKRATIYTVHDNFITTPPFVKEVPDIYTQVIIDMGPPLKIINDFIRINLIYPYYHSQAQYINVKELYDYNNNNPYHSVCLTDFLNSLSPTKDKKKWLTKVSEFINCYNNYIDSVCSETSHDVRWNGFKKLLENRSNNYSVHY